MRAAALLLAVLAAGCSQATLLEFTSRPQAATATAGGSAPTSTEYVGGGRTVLRALKVRRVCSPFGLSAGEVIARQRPLEIAESPAEPVRITAAGVESARGETSETKAGGGTWTLWDTVKSWLRPVLWTAAVIAGILLVLLIIPATRPGALAILRLIAAAVPMLGSLVEWRIGRKREGTTNT